MRDSNSYEIFQPGAKGLERMERTGFDNEGPPSPPSPFERWRLERYFVFFRKRWWILLISMAAFAGLALAFNRYFPKSYSSTAHLWTPGRLRLIQGAAYDDRSENLGATQSELLKSDLIRERALAQLRAENVPIPSHSNGSPAAVKLRTSLVDKVAILEIKCTGPEATYVRSYLNAIMDQLLAYKGELRAGEIGNAYATVNEQIKRQEADLTDQQEKLAVYMRSNNVAVLEEQAKAAGSYLSQLLAQLSELNLQYQLLKAAITNEDWMPDSRVIGSGFLSASNAVPTGGLVSSKPPAGYLEGKQQLESLNATHALFGKYFRPQHPKMAKLDAAIAQTERMLAFFQKENQEQLLAELRVVTLKIDNVQQAIKTWEQKLSDASERIADVERVRLNMERTRSYYDHLVTMLQSVDLGRSLDQEAISIMDRASPPKSAKPSGYLVMAAALFLGFLAGFAMILMIEINSNKVTSLDDLRSRFDEPIVGYIPEARTTPRKGMLPPLQADDERFLLAESYRSIRSALLFGECAKPAVKILVVTSAGTNEGKSTVSANLARTLAFSGFRVLLIDGDLRRGCLHEQFELPRDSGLSDLLAHKGSMENFVRTTQVENLSLLTRGKDAFNTCELLLSASFDDLLTQARQAYDFVVIDSVPILAADDTTSIASRVDGVIFVVRDYFTDAVAARRALGMLYARRAVVLGLLLNRANGVARSQAYYHYREYYNRKASA